jgi:hypothetical protein
MTRHPSPSEIRMEELCALRRDLTEDEQAEIMALKRRITNARCVRRRYARDPQFRQSEIERNLRRYRELRA